MAGRALLACLPGEGRQSVRLRQQAEREEQSRHGWGSQNGGTLLHLGTPLGTPPSQRRSKDLIHGVPQAVRCSLLPVNLPQEVTAVRLPPCDIQYLPGVVRFRRNWRWRFQTRELRIGKDPRIQAFVIARVVRPPRPYWTVQCESGFCGQAYLRECPLPTPCAGTTTRYSIDKYSVGCTVFDR